MQVSTLSSEFASTWWKILPSSVPGGCGGAGAGAGGGVGDGAVVGTLPPFCFASSSFAAAVFLVVRLIYDNFR